MQVFIKQNKVSKKKCSKQNKKPFRNEDYHYYDIIPT